MMDDDSEFCCRVFKREFNTSLVITKEHYKDFNKSTTGWICEKSLKQEMSKITLMENNQAQRIKFVT